MRIRETIKKIEKLETHHQIIVFCIILIVTILLTRFFVFLHNPDPVFFNFELHHFDYGVLLLLICTKLLLFGPKRHNLIYLFLSAVASGLIIDDYWFIRKNVIEDPILQEKIYNSTFPSVIILSVVIVLIILFIRSLSKSKNK